MSDDESARPAAEPTPAEPASPPEPALAAGPDTPAPGQPETSPADASPPPAQATAPNRLAVFLKRHAATLVLAVLLAGAIVWGALGMVSANDWESRAASLASTLASAEEDLADAEATIDDLETARQRAESTATACIGAIDDADAMLEVSAKLDDKTVVYLEGLNDFIAAVSAGDATAAQSIATEMDKLSAQLDDLSEQIEGHIDDYEDSAEGCHVDDAQDA